MSVSIHNDIFENKIPTYCMKLAPNTAPCQCIYRRCIVLFPPIGKDLQTDSRVNLFLIDFADFAVNSIGTNHFLNLCSAYSLSSRVRRLQCSVLVLRYYHNSEFRYQNTFISLSLYCTAQCLSLPKSAHFDYRGALIKKNLKDVAV